MPYCSGINGVAEWLPVLPSIGGFEQRGTGVVLEAEQPAGVQGTKVDLTGCAVGRLGSCIGIEVGGSLLPMLPFVTTGKEGCAIPRENPGMTGIEVVHRRGIHVASGKGRPALACIAGAI